MKNKRNLNYSKEKAFIPMTIWTVLKDYLKQHYHLFKVFTQS